MLILGIDPGLSKCGYGLIDVQAHRTTALAAGVIVTESSAERPARLAELQWQIRRLLDNPRPDAVAMERLLFQRNVSTAMAVGQAVGVILAEAASVTSEIYEYSPNEIKQAVTGHGNAGKHEVASMVVQLLDLPRNQLAALSDDEVPPDTTDALAIALCHGAMRPPQVHKKTLRVVGKDEQDPTLRHPAFRHSHAQESQQT